MGLAYNSATRRDGYFPGSVGDASSGWRLSTAADVRLRFPGNGSIVYHGPNGLTGTSIQSRVPTRSRRRYSGTAETSGSTRRQTCSISASRTADDISAPTASTSASSSAVA